MMNSGKLLIISAIMLMIAQSCICGCVSQANAGEPLHVYCGAGMQEPMDEIATAFTEKYGVDITYTYAGSNTLLSQIELTEKGDIYMPGATYYFDAAKEKGYVDEEEMVVYHVPIIVTPKGNPAGITCLDDLGKEDIRISLGDPGACAIGKLSNQILEKNGLSESVIPNVVVRTGTVNEVGADVSLEQVDAGIIWEDLYDPVYMEKIAISKEENIIKIVPIGMLSFSKNRNNAQKFIEFVTSDEGKGIFRKHGFTTYPDALYQ